MRRLHATYRPENRRLGKRITPTKLNQPHSQLNQKQYASGRNIYHFRGPGLVWGVLPDVEHWCDWTPTVTEIKALNGTGHRSERSTGLCSQSGGRPPIK